jgi:hypothetical protein
MVSSTTIFLVGKVFTIRIYSDWTDALLEQSSPMASQSTPKEQDMGQKPLKRAELGPP